MGDITLMAKMILNRLRRAGVLMLHRSLTGRLPALTVCSFTAGKASSAQVNKSAASGELHRCSTGTVHGQQERAGCTR